MIRSVPTEEVARAIETVFSIPADVEMEPYEEATALDDGDPLGLSVQRARFGEGSPEEVAGELLFSLVVPHSRLPDSSPLVASDPALDPESVDLPGDVSGDVGGTPTEFDDLGGEYEMFLDQLRETLTPYPVVEGVDDLRLSCISYDEETAVFGGSVDVSLDGEVDPADEVPPRLRWPRV